VFYTGSLSKQFTAASIAVAANDGHLDLDAPVRQYIPEVPLVAKDVTIRHLIHHTGGLREKWDLLAMQGVPVATTLITQQMVLDLVSRQRDVNFAAGTRYAYSNTGYDLLATAIDRTTGQSIREFARQRLFEPLGMTRTLYADRYGELIPDRVMGYAFRDGAWTLAPAMVETVGSGSVYSTVDDLLKWAAAFEEVPPTGGLTRIVEAPGTLNDGTPLTYAWGLVVDEWNGMRRVHHAGALAGYRTALWRLPEQKWAGVILCNSAEAVPSELMKKLLGLYVPSENWVPEDILRGVFTTEGPLVQTVIPEDIVGEYWSDELLTTWTIARRDSSYVLRRGTVPELPLRLGPGGFVMIGGWRIVIERDAAGQITVLRLLGGSSHGMRFGRR
jgi:CubicO group peptidase (beta-lactamase class C family)